MVLCSFLFSIEVWSIRGINANQLNLWILLNVTCWIMLALLIGSCSIQHKRPSGVWALGLLVSQREENRSKQRIWVNAVNPNCITKCKMIFRVRFKSACICISVFRPQCRYRLYKTLLKFHRGWVCPKNKVCLISTQLWPWTRASPSCTISARVRNSVW